VSSEVVTSPPGSPMGPVLDALPTIRDPVGIERSGEEGALKDMITRHGREDGIRRYLASSRNKATRDGNPALFQAAQRLVRSYRRDPW